MTKLLLATLLFLSPFAVAQEDDSLRTQLEARRENPKIPEDAHRVTLQAFEELRKRGIEKNAPKEGDVLPDFTLPHYDGTQRSLSQLLEKGPVVVTFYRGSWCAFCNLQLDHFQKHLEEFRGAGATIVAITPEQPNLTKEFAARKKLAFDLLWDKNNAYAKKVGVSFRMPKEQEKLYRSWGIDLKFSQGNSKWELPVPATFVVGKGRKILYSFVDVDYTHRAETKDVLKAVRGN